jgi:hypothetical protein
MLVSAVRADKWIVGRHGGPSAQRGLNQSGRTRSGSAGATGRAAGTRAWSSGAKATDSTAGSSLHHTRIYAAKESACLGAKNVRIRDRKIVTGNRKIQIVFECKINGVFQREIELPIPD